MTAHIAIHSVYLASCGLAGLLYALRRERGSPFGDAGGSEQAHAVTGCRE